MGKFEKGKRQPNQGGPRGGGRPTKEQQATKQQVADQVKDYIEKNVKPVLETYQKLAKGYYETRYNDGGMEYTVFVPDGATTRHWIDKFVPAAKQEIELTGKLQIVEVKSNVDD